MAFVKKMIVNIVYYSMIRKVINLRRCQMTEAADIILLLSKNQIAGLKKRFDRSVDFFVK
jgi:hypothetical protein